MVKTGVVVGEGGKKRGFLVGGWEFTGGLMLRKKRRAWLGDSHGKRGGELFPYLLEAETKVPSGGNMDLKESRTFCLWAGGSRKGKGTGAIKGRNFSP